MLPTPFLPMEKRMPVLPVHTRDGSLVGGRGTIQEGMSQPRAKGCRVVGGPGWKDFSKRKKAVGDAVVTGKSLEPKKGQACLPKKDRKSCALSPSLAFQKPESEGNGR